MPVFRNRGQKVLRVLHDSSPIPLKQGLSLNSGFTSQLDWKSASTNNSCGAEVPGVGETYSLLCGFLNLNSNPQDCGVRFLND